MSMEKIEMLESDQFISGNLLYNQLKTVGQWRKMSSSINCAGFTGYPYGKK